MNAAIMYYQYVRSCEDDGSGIAPLTYDSWLREYYLRDQH